MILFVNSLQSKIYLILRHGALDVTILRKKIRTYLSNEETLIFCILSERKWFRKYIGGHWEHLQIGDTHCGYLLWFHRKRCSIIHREDRMAGQHGQGRCEDYNVRS